MLQVASKEKSSVKFLRHSVRKMSGPGIILITTMAANTPQLKAFAADITLWTLGSLMNSPPLADAELPTISSLRNQKKKIALGA